MMPKVKAAPPAAAKMTPLIRDQLKAYDVTDEVLMVHRLKRATFDRIKLALLDGRIPRLAISANFGVDARIVSLIYKCKLHEGTHQTPVALRKPKSKIVPPPPPKSAKPKPKAPRAPKTKPVIGDPSTWKSMMMQTYDADGLPIRVTTPFGSPDPKTSTVYTVLPKLLLYSKEELDLIIEHRQLDGRSLPMLTLMYAQLVRDTYHYEAKQRRAAIQMITDRIYGTVAQRLANADGTNLDPFGILIKAEQARLKPADTGEV